MEPVVILTAGGVQRAGGKRGLLGNGSEGRALFMGQPGACEGLRVPAFLLHFAPAVCGSWAKVEHSRVEQVPEEGRGQQCLEPLSCLGKLLSLSLSLSSQGSSLSPTKVLSQPAHPEHLHFCS